MTRYAWSGSGDFCFCQRERERDTAKMLQVALRLHSIIPFAICHLACMSTSDVQNFCVKYFPTTPSLQRYEYCWSNESEVLPTGNVLCLNSYWLPDSNQKQLTYCRINRWYQAAHLQERGCWLISDATSGSSYNLRCCQWQFLQSDWSQNIELSVDVATGTWFLQNLFACLFQTPCMQLTNVHSK